jgi:hypothetical protein
MGQKFNAYFMPKWIVCIVEHGTGYLTILSPFGAFFEAITGSQACRPILE